MLVDPILADGIRLLRRRKYLEAIHFLEKIDLNRYNASFTYYYILGLACLYAEDFGGAYVYLQQAREIKMREPRALLGLAVLFLRRGDTHRAVDFYLEVQELDPKNKTARRALQAIRKYSGSDELIAYINQGQLISLYPPKPRQPRNRRRGMGVLLACSIIAVLGTGGFFLWREVISKWEKTSDRAGFSDATLERGERDAPILAEGTYRYTLSAEEVLSLYAEARNLFAEYRDEAAKVALNRIIESNAVESIKNKARILISYMNVPGFNTLKDFFSYQEVMEDPLLYRDCYVVWKGMVSNLQTPEVGTSFYLLVGYESQSVMEGIVPVNFEFSVPVNPERPLEALGRVVPTITSQGIDLRLEGVAIHQSGLLEVTEDLAEERP